MLLFILNGVFKRSVQILQDSPVPLVSVVFTRTNGLSVNVKLVPATKNRNALG